MWYHPSPLQVGRGSLGSTSAFAGYVIIRDTLVDYASPSEREVTTMANQFNAIIIGTGFGATVALSALRAKKQSVLMLERGLWFFTPERPLPPYITKTNQPVQFWPRPDHRDGLIDLLAMARTSLEPHWVRDAANWLHRLVSPELERQPLYRYNVFPQIDILTASGVGGGSLVYSNVSIEPYYDGKAYPVMERWPEALTPAHYNAARDWMTKYRGPAHKVVTRIPLPKQFRDTMKTNPGDPSFDVDALPKQFESLYLRKSFALKHAAENMASPWKAKMNPDGWQGLDLQINEPEEDMQTYDYANRPICERQGRCLLGCLPAARHTLNKTLLSKFNLGADPGFQVQPLSEVDYIRALPNDSGYEVVYFDVRDGSKHSVSAPKVILAAGCLGSSEILLRSAAQGLKVSQKAGSLFSSNGDFAGFAVNIAPNVTQNGASVPNPVWPAYATRGPINTAHVMFQEGKLHFTIEDSAIPAMFAAPLRFVLDVLERGTSDPHFSKLSGIWTGRALSDLLPFIPDVEKAERFETEAEMLMDVFFFNTMATDGAKGQFGLSNGRLTLDFSNDALANDPVFQKTEEILKAMAEAMGGQFRTSFLWDGFTKRRIITVHPLGGCPMGNSSSDGAVDKNGRVFQTATGSQDVYKGLVVMDASIIPGALAVNPTLTIVAQCLRIAETL